MACSPHFQAKLRDLACGQLEGPEADAVLGHTLECAACASELELLADLTTALAREGSGQVQGAAARSAASSLERQRAPGGLFERFRRPRRLLAAAALLVAALLAGRWVLDDGKGPRGLAGLADTTPFPFVEGILRGGGGETKDAGERFATAMRAYQAADHATAAALLEKLLAEDPADHKLRVYLGVSRLQLGDAAGALEALRAAAEKGEGLVRERALWYIAMASLVREDAEEARRALEALRDTQDGHYALNAASLLLELQKLMERDAPQEAPPVPR